MKLEASARRFQLLADPIRLQILCLLQQQEYCVNDICQALNLSQPKVSYHLKIMLEAGLIKRRVVGTWCYYRLCTDIGDWIKHECDALFKERAAVGS